MLVSIGITTIKEVLNDIFDFTSYISFGWWTSLGLHWMAFPSTVSSSGGNIPFE